MEFILQGEESRRPDSASTIWRGPRSNRHDCSVAALLGFMTDPDSKLRYADVLGMSEARLRHRRKTQ